MSKMQEYLRLLNNIYHPGIDGNFSIPLNPTQKDINYLKKEINKNKKRVKNI